MEYLRQSLADKENGYSFLCEGIAVKRGLAYVLISGVDETLRTGI